MSSLSKKTAYPRVLKSANTSSVDEHIYPSVSDSNGYPAQFGTQQKRGINITDIMLGAGGIGVLGVIIASVIMELVR